MKILNWMHRRLHGTMISSVSLHSQKGYAVESITYNQEVELQERSMVKVPSIEDKEEALLGWGEGLLAIGTLGLHTPHPDSIITPRFSFRYSNSVSEHKDSLSDDHENLDTTTDMEDTLAGDNDEKPLVCNAYNHHEIEEADDEQMIVAIAPFKHEAVAEVSNISSSGVKSDRTTLADLFKAEHNKFDLDDKSSCSILKDVIKEEKLKKFPTSFSTKLMKKLIPSHEVQPIKNINHMIRKMMKRKIHPDHLLPRENSASEMERWGKPLTTMDEIQANEDMSGSSSLC